MANTRTFFRSFAGGEVSPEMFGRVDDAHYQTGAALMRNFIARPQGPAVNRPGTMFVRAVKDSNKKTRLIPFTYSTTQTMVIEVGYGYFRFHTQGATLQSPTPSAWNGATNYSVGDLVLYGGIRYYSKANTNIAFDPDISPSWWYAMPGTIYEIPNTYAEGTADLFDLHYAQSGDVLTIVHPQYAPRELKRISATKWTFTEISFAPNLAPPENPAVSATTGQTSQIASISSATPAIFTLPGDPPFAVGSSVFVKGCTGTPGFVLADGYYTCYKVTLTANTFQLANYSTGVPIGGLAGAYTANSGKIQLAARVYDTTNYYVVTALDRSNRESLPSAEVNVVNNLYVTGSYNTITWTSVASANRYNVYKRINGLYGYIGQTDLTTFVDDNISADLGITPPDTDGDNTWRIPVDGQTGSGPGYWPGAVGYFEQRRVFAGSTYAPQAIWMTQSGSETSLAYHIPVLDTDRIMVSVAARESATIKHVVPMTQLLMLTSSSELRVSPANSDVLTPSNIAVRPQSYIGANGVQPAVVNNSVVYCGARGGRVRELGYNWQANGFITGDLSIRAAHLFDTYTISDMAFSKAPFQIVWFISSTGKLLGLSYVPEQQVGAWHQHDTDGVFESCACVSEGTEDYLYVIVKRTVNGSSVRYIERMASRQVGDLKDCVFTDSSLSYDGANTSIATMTASVLTTWDAGQTIRLTATSATPFAYSAQTDVNDVIVLTAADGTQYRCKIISTSSTSVATVLPDKAITVASGLRNTATTNWAFARDSVSGLSHLEGKTVSILADGAVVPQQVVTSGAVSLPRACTKITVGLPYQSDLQTLPVALQMDGYGQGRMKNVNKAWLRVYQSSGIFIGPDADHLVEAKQRTTEPYGSPPSLKSDEILVVMTPSWATSGQIYVRQSDPLPLTIVGLTAEVSIGG